MSRNSEASTIEMMVVFSMVDHWSAFKSVLQDSCKDKDHQSMFTLKESHQVCYLNVEDRSMSLCFPELNPDMTQEDIEQAFDRCFKSCSHGIDVFLLLIQDGVYTKRERRLMEVLQAYFGAEAFKYLIILTVQDGHVVDRLDEDLFDLIKACDNRYCRVKANDVLDGLQALVKMVDSIVSENGSSGCRESMLCTARKRSTEHQALEMLRQKLGQAIEKEQNFKELVEQREASRARHMRELKAKYTNERQEEAAEKKKFESRRQSLEEALNSLSVQLQKTTSADEESQKISVILLGLSGSGKSSALSLLQRASGQYSVSDFISDQALPTVYCKKKEVSVAGKRVILVDTPELWDEDGIENTEFVKDCLALALPGPHIFLLVLQMGRFTQGESEMLGHLQKIFRREFVEYTIILFIQAESDQHRHQRINDYVAGAHSALQDLIQKCGSRYYELNISKSQNALSYLQVKDLLLGINKVVAAHGGQAYTVNRFSPQELKDRSKELERRKEGGLEQNYLLREV